MSDEARTAICRQCGLRYELGQRSNQHKRAGMGMIGSRFCSDACRQAAYRSRRQEARVTHPETTPLPYVRGAVTAPLQATESIEEFRAKKTVEGRDRRRWVWRERLDGSADLYCDWIGGKYGKPVEQRHVARVIRDGGRYRLAKPVNLAGMIETWPTLRDAARAVKALMRQV